jgi:hypothetical protein
MNKYILLFSVILNGVLLMLVTGIVPFFLYLSIIINLILLWYSGICLLRVNNLESDMVVLLQKNEDFLDELEDIHSLEMYYGDEYLQNLIGKSRDLVNDFIDVQEEYFDVQVTELEDDEEETPTQEE